MAGNSELMAKILDGLDQAGQIALSWLLSPAAWSQFGLLALSYLAARLLTARVLPIVSKALTPAEDKQGLIRRPCGSGCGFCRSSCRFWPMG